MIILKQEDKKILASFLLLYKDKNINELAYVKKHINSNKTLNIFQYKSYYLLTYAHFENFYRLFSLEIIKMANKQHFGTFRNFIDESLINQKIKTNKIYITNNNAYIRVYEKNTFLNSDIFPKMSKISSLIKRRFFCGGLENHITKQMTDKVEHLTNIRNDLIHESNSRKHSDIESYKNLLKELIIFFDNIFEAIIDWISSRIKE